VDEYVWDYRNRLTAVTSKDGTGVVTQTVGYEYDTDDQRVSKTVNGVVEKYIIDRNQIAFVTDGSGTETFHYLYGLNIDSVMAQDSPTGMVWSLGDRLGSINLLADAGGAVVDKRTFDSFGRVLSETNPNVNFRYGYTGRETDGETGLDYYRARYYDAGNGRFISVDPMGFRAGDTNLYRYVGNSSTGFTDPTGEFAFLPLLGLIALGGFIGGATDAIRQGLKIAEGSQEGFNWGEFGSSVGFGAVVTPLAAASPAFAVALGAYGAFTGSSNGMEEIRKGNVLSGGFELATSLLPFVSKAGGRATGQPYTPFATSNATNGLWNKEVLFGAGQAKSDGGILRTLTDAEAEQIWGGGSGQSKHNYENFSNDYLKSVFDSTISDSSLLPGVTREQAFSLWTDSVKSTSKPVGKIGNFNYADTNGHGIRGKVSHDGILRFEIMSETGNPKREINGGKIGKQLETGQDMFARMMVYYRGKIKKIEADWTNANPNMMDNYNRFNELTKNGKDQETAAFNTFTGKMAKKFGYNKFGGVIETIDRDGSHHYYVTFSKD
jgi:RHS repeat-associated protein